jgi:hypothetical protein
MGKSCISESVSLFTTAAIDFGSGAIAAHFVLVMGDMRVKL